MAKHQRNHAANHRNAAGAPARSVCDQCTLFLTSRCTRTRTRGRATAGGSGDGELPCWLADTKNVSAALRFAAWVGLECVHETAQACWEQRDLITSIRITNQLRDLCEQMRDEWRTRD